MAVFSATREIGAPIDAVFTAVANIEEFRNVVPEIIDVEYLSDQRSGLGTRFVETRVIGKRTGKTELEVVEYEPNERVRLVAEAGGSTWDTVYTLEPAGSGTRVTMVMTATAHTVRARMLNKIIASTVGRAIERDLDAVKDYCESRAG
jgi:carbon monoxide dehydrogenase subunit G